MKKSRIRAGCAFNCLEIELTERCNNNCLHCYINLPACDRAVQARELPTHEVKKIIAEAARLGYLKVRFTGGEPLLRDDFEELYLFSRKAGLLVSIFTNATLITPRLVSVFVRIPPLRPLEISLYGMTRRSYEATTRVPGTYAAAYRGIALLEEKKVPFVIKGVFLPGHASDRGEFRDWLSSHPGIEGRVADNIFYPRCRRDDPRRNRVISELRSAEGEFRVRTRSKKSYTSIMRDFCRKFLHAPDDRIFKCNCGCGGCVDAYGKFQPCMLVRHNSCVYDLKKGSLEQAMNNFFPAFLKLKSSNPEYLNRCGRCFLKGLCEQCPGTSWMEHGTLDTPVEYYCKATHAQAIFVGLLRKGEHAWEVSGWRERIQDFLNRGE